jgi:excisionase family DNA binding protein
MLTEHLTTKQVADRLGIQEGSVRTLIRRGKLSAFHVGRTLLIPVSEVDRYARESAGMRGWSQEHKSARTDAIRQAWSGPAAEERRERLRQLAKGRHEKRRMAKQDSD